LIFYDGTWGAEGAKKKNVVLIKSSKSCIPLNPMACGTCAREQELQRAILLT